MLLTCRPRTRITLLCVCAAPSDVATKPKLVPASLRSAALDAIDQMINSFEKFHDKGSVYVTSGSVRARTGIVLAHLQSSFDTSHKTERLVAVRLWKVWPVGR